jgi:hypothetical protein
MLEEVAMMPNRRRSGVKNYKDIVTQQAHLKSGVQQFMTDMDEMVSQFGYQVVPMLLAESNGLEVAEVETLNRDTVRKVRKAVKKNVGRFRKTIACPKCDRKFAMALHLGRHMKSHEGK